MISRSRWHEQEWYITCGIVAVAVVMICKAVTVLFPYQGWLISWTWAIPLGMVAAAMVERVAIARDWA